MTKFINMAMQTKFDVIIGSQLANRKGNFA